MPALVSAFQKIILQRQFADLGVQRFQIDGGLFRLALLLTEHAGRAFEKLAFPRRDLVRMNVELLRQLRQRPIALHGGQSHLRLECRRMIAARSFRHIKLLIRSENPRRCQAENPLMSLFKFATPALRTREEGRSLMLMTLNVADERLTTAHRAKLAYVYVRQSSVNQVRQHQESTELQYRLVDRAVGLGWPRERVQVIDEDLGKSGAGGVERHGFQKLIAEVGLGNAGLVVSLDASRLARNNRDWHQLLELCSVFGVLIADGERLYDPRIYHDRLLLGLSGIMSEAELHQIRMRLHQGERQKAGRGELRLPLPAGLAHDRAGAIILNRDEEVQARIHLVFAKFGDLQSARAVMRFLRANGLQLPVRPVLGPSPHNVVWREADSARVSKFQFCWVQSPLVRVWVHTHTQETRMKADNKNTLIAALTIATLLTAGGALAANEPQPVQQKSTARQIAVDKEFGKISADGSSAFQDLTLTRLAIFDGRIDAAKKYIDKADTALGKAKTDEALFVKAEADLKSTTTKGAEAKKSAGAVAPVTDQQKDQKEELVTWLPVDGSITINDDYTASAPKTAAIAEANKNSRMATKKARLKN